MSADKSIDRLSGVSVKLLLIGLFAFHFVPMLISAYYNLPTSVDDYCFAATVKEYGMCEAQYMYYTQESGRYISTFLQHVFNSLSYDSTIGFKVLPVVFLAGMIGAVQMIVRQLFVGNRSWLIALVFTSVFVSQLPSLSEGLYWFSSLVVHWLGLILFFVNCAFLLWSMNNHTRKKTTVFWSVFMIIVSAGASEPTFLSFLLLCFAVVVYQFVKTKRVQNEVLILTAAGIAGALLIKFSVANIGKQNKSISELTPDLFLRVASELFEFGTGFVSWYLLAAFLLYVVVLGNKIKETKFFNLPVWYALLVWSGILYFNHLVGVVGIGGSAPRVLNIIFMFFLSGLLFLISVIWHKYGVAIATNKIMVAGFLFIAVIASMTTKTLQIYKDVKNGVFVNYNAEINERNKVLASEKEIIVLPLIDAKPYSLFFYDMNTNPHGLWTKCLGSYYGKDNVTFKEN